MNALDGARVDLNFSVTEAAHVLSALQAAARIARKAGAHGHAEYCNRLVRRICADLEIEPGIAA